MPIRFYCPLGHRLVVPDERAGKKGRCPQCHQKVYVPVADPQPSGRAKRPVTSEPIALDAATTDPPEILEPPVARAANERKPSGGQTKATARGSSRGRAARPLPAPDPHDPAALALDEIAALPRCHVATAERPDERLSAFDSISEWLPPPATTPPATTPQAIPASIAAPPPSMAAVPETAIPPAAAVTPRAPAPPAAQLLAAAPALPAISTAAVVQSRGWIRPASDDEIARAFQPDSIRQQLVYLLAGALPIVALFSSWPALVHFQRGEAAAWVAAVLGMSVAALVYVVWLLSLTDWSTLRVGMMLCACWAAVYACGLALIIGTPASKPIPLGLADVRSSAGLWCALQMGLWSAACYGFGRQAMSWRDEARGLD